MSKTFLRKLFIAFLSVLVLTAVVLGLLEYGQVQGFKNTLRSLVLRGTDGQFALDLGNTKINYLDLSFELEDVTLTPTENNLAEEGVRAVKIPALKVNIGSLFDYAVTRQMDVQEVEIVEPYVQVRLKEKKKKVEHINIAHELASFTPAIQAFLEQFKIESFRIIRAGTVLNPPDSREINITLIDLFVRNWNMKDLGEDALIELDIKDQHFIFERSTFSFEDVEYNYQENELSINGYHFETRDSLGRDVLLLTGEKISIRDADYMALIEREEYVFGHLQISKPVVVANVYPVENPDTIPKSRQPISDLLKQNLGSMLLKSGNLDNATLFLNIYRPEDSISLELPGIFMEAKNLMVREDSSTMLIEQLSLKVDSSTIDLGSELSVSFSSMFYDHDYNIFLSDLRLINRIGDQEILTGENFTLYNLSIFKYLYDNRIEVDSIILNRGNIHVTEPLQQVLAGMESDEEQKSQDPADLFFGKVQLDDINLTYKLHNDHIQVYNLTALVDDIERTDKLTYDLRYIESDRILGQVPEGDFDIRKILYRPRHFEVEKLTFEKNDSRILIENFFAQPENFLLEVPDARSWEMIEIGNLEADGDLSYFISRESGPSQEHVELFLWDVRVARLRLDITLADTMNLRLQGHDLELIDWESVESQMLPGNISGYLENVDFSSRKIALQIGELEFDSGTRSEIRSVRLSTSGGDSLHIRDLVVDRIRQEDNQINIDHIGIYAPGFSGSGKGEINADSIVVTNLSYWSDSPPGLEQVEVFGPDVNWKIKKDAGESTRESTAETQGTSFHLPETLIIHPGSARLGEERIQFGQVTLESGEGSALLVEARDIGMNTPGSRLSIGKIWSDRKQISVDDVRLIPDPEYVSSLTTENEVVEAQIDRIIFENLPWDSVQQPQFTIPHVKIDGFNIAMYRDKRMDDPVQEERPYLLSEILPFKNKVLITELRAENGVLHYRETSDRTGRTGHISLHDINLSLWPEASADNGFKVLEGELRVYNSGLASFTYREPDSTRFSLALELKNMDLTHFNKMVDSLEAVRIKSGFMEKYDLFVTGDSIRTTGEALVTYNDLHIEIFKKNQPQTRNFGSVLLSLIADGIILRSSRNNAVAPVSQDRIIHKGPVNYWVKSLIKGATTAIRKGRKPK